MSETRAAFLAELEAASGLDPAFERELAALRTELVGAGAPEAGARRLVERMALALQASVLLRAASPVAELFCRSRLGGERGLAFGTLPVDAHFSSIIDRALP